MGKSWHRDELKEASLRRAEPVLEKKLVWCVGKVVRLCQTGEIRGATMAESMEGRQYQAEK